jgi:alpha-L-fucosidase 2
MNSSDMFKCHFFKIPFKVLTTFLFFFSIAECFCQEQVHKLFYTKPASQFEEALLMGNGRIGATIYGGVEEERISLNEATLWSGGPFDPSMNKKAKDYLQPVREALFDENYKKADSLMKFMQGKYSESYAPLGNLFINFNHALSAASDYKRELDISNAYTKISYEIDGTNFTREYFVSYPDQVLVIRLISQGKNKLNISCHFNSLLIHSQKSKGDDLMMHGFSPVHAEPNYRGNIPNAIINDTIRSMRFVAQLRVLKNDGNIKIKNSEIQISDANEIVLLVSLATSYNGPEKNPGLSGKDEVKIAESHVKKAVKKSFSILKQRHTDDYRKYFDRVYLDLGHTDQEANATMDRLNNFALGKTDNSLMVLFFQYSRYLLISASRPGGMPANLQGIWNEAMRPPWSSNYTTNINAEMNYWGQKFPIYPNCISHFWILLEGCKEQEQLLPEIISTVMAGHVIITLIFGP